MAKFEVEKHDFYQRIREQNEQPIRPVEDKVLKLKHKDLVCIQINYNDDTEKIIYVDWAGDNDYHNPNQKCYVSKEKEYFYMVIGEGKEIVNIFGPFETLEHIME